jgi:formylglycine-generating enzyme required for sulfatase activity
MVLIPAGEFVMGSAREGERPQRRVHLEACLIDKHEVTVAQFRKFVQETGYVTEAERAGGARVAPVWDKLRPDVSWKNPGFKQVVCVSWNDAVAYCEWAGKR